MSVKSEVLLVAHKARAHPLFSRVTPLTGRLLVAKPVRQTAERRSAGEHGKAIIIPDKSSSAAYEGLVVALILKVGVECNPAFEPDQFILIPEFSGLPVRDLDDGNETVIFLIGDGDVACLLVGESLE